MPAHDKNLKQRIKILKKAKDKIKGKTLIKGVDKNA